MLLTIAIFLHVLAIGDDNLLAHPKHRSVYMHVRVAWLVSLISLSLSASYLYPWSFLWATVGQLWFFWLNQPEIGKLFTSTCSSPTHTYTQTQSHLHTHRHTHTCAVSGEIIGSSKITVTELELTTTCMYICTTRTRINLSLKTRELQDFR